MQHMCLKRIHKLALNRPICTSIQGSIAHHVHHVHHVDVPDADPELHRNPDDDGDGGQVVEVGDHDDQYRDPILDRGCNVGDLEIF